MERYRACTFKPVLSLILLMDAWCGGLTGVALATVGTLVLVELVHLVFIHRLPGIQPFR